jgi:class 3 adenylate cyclase
MPDDASETSERRLVTIVFADLVGSTQLTNALDPEAVRETARGWFARVRAEVEKHGGRVEKFAGDGVMAIFGVPRVHDDDAARAARAALDIIDITERYASSLPERVGSALSVRVGLESGEVVVAVGSGDQFIATGIAVNTAARLQGLANANSALVGPNASRLLDGWADFGVRSALQLKGLDVPIDAHELVAVHSHRPDRPGRHSLPFAGRAADLALLRAIAMQAQSTRSPHLVALIGPAGIGKSRLAHQAILGLDALVVRGRCPSYGDASGLYPVAQIVNDVAGFVGHQPTIDELRSALLERLGTAPRAAEVVDVLSRLDDVYGVTPPQLDDVIWAMREMVGALGRERSLVVVVEDIHWASERLIRVMSRVASEVRDASVLVVFTARPEIADEPAAWISAGSNSHTINLAPLSNEDVRWLIQETLIDVDDDVVERVVTSAEGNPLFVNMLLQEKGTRINDDLPLGVVALANARLHQLPEDERLLLGRAAVLGRVFYPRGVEFISGDDPERISELLVLLKARRLVHESATDLVDEPAMSFDHALIQEAAYRQLPKAQRIELHAAAAEWLTGISQHPSTFQAIAHHRKMAVDRAVELGVDPVVLVELKRAAARAAFDAAHSLDATSSGAVSEYLRSCIADTTDVELKAKAFYDLILVFDQVVSQEEVDPVVSEAEQIGRPDLAHLLTAGLYYQAAGAMNLSWGDFRAEAIKALTTTTTRGDNQLVVRALISLAQAEQQLAPGAAVEAARNAWQLIEDGDNLLTSSTANLLLGSAANLNASFDAVQAIVNDVLSVTASFRVEHRGISVLARFAAASDLTDELQILLNRHHEMAQRLRPFEFATNVAFMLAPALAVVERHQEALDLWDSGAAHFEEFFGHDVMASVWPEQALSHLALGNVDQARALVVDDNRTTASDDDMGLAQFHAARARLAAVDGDAEAVGQHAAEALRWIDSMAMGACVPQRLRLEVATALAGVGKHERAKVLALTSREQALALSAFAIVRRANDVLATLPQR